MLSRPDVSRRPGYLGYEYCQSMRDVLVGENVDPAWSKRAQNVMQRVRTEHSFLKDEPSPMLDKGEEIMWWTFAGSGASKCVLRSPGSPVITCNCDV